MSNLLICLSPFDYKLNNTPASLRVLSSFLFAQKERYAICAQRVRLPIYVGADLIIQVGSDLILLCSVIYKFVSTKTFNYHGTIA